MCMKILHKIILLSPLTQTNFIIEAGFASSKSEAKRLIKGGGARVNDVKVDSESATVSRDDFDNEGRLKISSGKKKNALIVL